MAAGDGAPGEQLDGGLAGRQGQTCRVRGAGGSISERGNTCKEPSCSLAWASLPAPGRDGKAAGVCHHRLLPAALASRPRGWWGGWGPSPLRTGPPEVGVIPSAPAVPPPRRQQLSEEELERLEEACDMALELNASKHRIYEYVESRMSFIAPNLSIIIGASTAAKIMGEARPRTHDFGEACPFPVNRGVFYTSWGPARGHYPHPLMCPEIADHSCGRQSWGPAAAGAAGHGQWGGWGPGAAW